jgi:hypothetical protein
MGLYEGRGNLNKSTKQLLLAWNETKLSWDDRRTHEFEEKYIVPLQAEVRTAVGAMDQLAGLIQRIRGEVSPG